MGDFNECMRRGLFFIATSKDHFSEITILVAKQTGSDNFGNVNTQENFSSFSILVVLLIIFGIEQGLSYIRSLQVSPSETSNCKSISYSENDQPRKDEAKEDSVVIVEEKPVSVNSERIEYLYPTNDKASLDMMEKLREGIISHPPKRSEDGTSGVYFMKNSYGRAIAVFKPADEEGSLLESHSEEIKPGFTHGEGYLKEVAAYLLDRDGFHGVPRTTLVQCVDDVFNGNGASTKKVGSLQEFVPSECAAEEMGWNRFSVHDVHKIGLLDCRILNADRHLGNILVTDEDGEFRLVPIDHGLSLPSYISGSALFEWLQFPQCKQPFDEETVNFVCNIDVDSDVQILRSQLPDLKEECIETMRICTIFLKKAVARGMNLFEIGCMMSRFMGEEEMSKLEKMYIRVSDRTTRNSSNFWTVVDEEIDATLESK